MLAWCVSAWLLGVGLYGIVTSRNYIHLIGCLSVCQSATYVLLLGIGFRWHAGPPIFYDHPPGTPAVDPVVQALVLTDIVVSAAMTSAAAGDRAAGAQAAGHAGPAAPAAAAAGLAARACRRTAAGDRAAAVGTGGAAAGAGALVAAAQRRRRGSGGIARPVRIVRMAGGAIDARPDHALVRWLDAARVGTTGRGAWHRLCRRSGQCGGGRFLRHCCLLPRSYLPGATSTRYTRISTC